MKLSAKLWDVVLPRGGAQGSELSFGGVDQSKYQGQINWTPVTSETYWQIGIDGFVPSSFPHTIPSE